MLFKYSHRKNDAKKLPGSVYAYMMHKFILQPEYLDKLKCFEYNGLVNGKEVNRIHIYSPHRAKEQHLNIITRIDLEQHPEMLLFEGHIDKQGNVYVADRRQPVKPVKVKSVRSFDKNI